MFKHYSKINSKLKKFFALRNVIILAISFIILFFLWSYLDQRAKKHYMGTRNLGSHCYAEFYEISSGGAGVFSGSLSSAYFTDSNKTDYFLGTIHDDEGFDFYNDSSRIIIKKYLLIKFSFKEFARKKYTDSLYFDIKTKSFVEKQK